VEPESLRDRKKRLTRQEISDVATAMFLDRGFEEVRVAEIAAAAGVSEKTVFNYFPTKESLLLDREPQMAEAIRSALGPGSPQRSPVAGALEMFDRELDDLRRFWVEADDQQAAADTLRRFMHLVMTTPALQAATLAATERLTEVAAQAMAERAGVGPDEPEPQAAATVLLGLWRLQYRALRRHLDTDEQPVDCLAATAAEVRRAAALVDAGLWTFSAVVAGADSRDQLYAAGQATWQAARQVATSLRRSRELWRQVQHEQHQRHAKAHADMHRARAEAHAQARRTRDDAHAEARRMRADVHAEARRLREQLRQGEPGVGRDRP
jgi:AcrR family transcriptional regulator